LCIRAIFIGKITGQLLPGEKDPSRRVRAWKQAAAFVEVEREKLQQEGKPAFIICSHYGITGLFSFYLPQAKATLQSQPLVYSMDSDKPENQFYFWPEYNYREHRKGQNAIFVSEVDPYPLERGWLWKWLTHQPIEYSKIPPPPPMPSRSCSSLNPSPTSAGAKLKSVTACFIASTFGHATT
jgi:hypothetical protein